METHIEYRKGQDLAIKELESLPIYLWPLDLKSWAARIAAQVNLNKAGRLGLDSIMHLVDRLPRFGMAWRLRHLVQQLTEHDSIDPEDPDLWRKD